MKQYVVDAFTDQVFSGNPAAVCVLDQWPSEEFMTKMAVENNLSETAFTVKTGDRYDLRWFTPGGEVELCGHATLATSFVLFNFFEKELDRIVYDSLSGELTVRRDGDLYELNFPAFQLKEQPVTQEIIDALGDEPSEVYTGADLLCVFDSEEKVRNLCPDQEKLRKLFGVCQHVTARGEDYDCVTRTFGPKCNIVEDPVCGRGHCHVVPYWSGRLGRDKLVAYQASSRGGTLYCTMAGDRVRLAGKAVLFSIDEVFANSN